MGGKKGHPVKSWSSTGNPILMSQNAENAQANKVRLKRRERIRIFWYCALLVCGLFVYDLVTGEIRGDYPLLNKAIRSREGRGMHLIGSINRAQQAYFMEKGKFSTSIAALGLGSPTETSDYRLRLLPQSTAQMTIVTADVNEGYAEEQNLRIYRGAVSQITAKDGTRTTIAILCQQPRGSRRSLLFGTPKPPAQPPALPYYSQADQTLHCGEGSVDAFR